MHYQLMSLEDIKNMPVADLAEENAHLWLWIPNGLLQEGLDVIVANYDRGWDICPTTKEAELALCILLNRHN